MRRQRPVFVLGATLMFYVQLVSAADRERVRRGTCDDTGFAPFSDDTPPRAT
ncbi:MULTISPECIES: hypothetical protein [unclassified Streptomyces]|uniref:hypothetical protein n=1 Tax=unclassified Streptomyces TaxID=2593676 RepID=UPI000374E759|nr:MULTISPECIES: hypothetical protein [unclassified Streptomyces]